ncbi:LPS export ABC transporter periplasmic protein LptC [Marinospirillum alkaliphilum]|uniref:Lipopolysaccharide export system protein LptC n=1 Tax=Marinospirillum alkaliphilum DSM 21637 TaxID=1122209 RepID=A0A1K1TN45_9GAMM|nr:LPS export ABC transporter periplasmic protein LptC [Marinospirillum alkaliphilum]SFX02167.1 LPS export ABC transporter protein LptC [Marinospirillum alkaliphilum DSM 21637]
MPGLITRLNSLITPGMRRLAGVLALLLLGGVIVWLQESTQTPPYTALPREHGEPDYYIEQARLSRFDAEGRLLQVIHAEQVTHYPENDLALMQLPVVYHHGESGQSWRLQALRAEYRSNQELYLEEQVILQPIDPESAYLPEFTTNRLWVDTNAQQANTPDPVHFTSPGGVTQGIGLAVDMQTGLAEILQQVSGSYLTNPPSQEPLP